jgi:L-lactate dehydrogenase complex protein LldE
VAVALYIPCYVDQIKPEVGRATVWLLERLGLEFTLLTKPACCGQPFINMGAVKDAECLVRQFGEEAAKYEAIVCPSGSCVSSLRESQAASGLGARVFELSEYLLRAKVKLESLEAVPQRVLLHPSCHGLRLLGLGKPSEKPHSSNRDTVAELLSQVPALELLFPPKRDECCGFGGVFSVVESALSVRMGQDRVREYQEAGAEVVTATDVSCLMHLEGVAAALGLPLKFKHFAEILAPRAT